MHLNTQRKVDREQVLIIWLKRSVLIAQNPPSLRIHLQRQIEITFFVSIVGDQFLMNDRRIAPTKVDF